MLFRNRSEIRQRAAEPTLVHIKLSASDAASLTLPAPASCSRRTESCPRAASRPAEIGRALQLLHRLIEIDDVDLLRCSKMNGFIFGFHRFVW
jgi:hypothetical protein